MKITSNTIGNYGPGFASQVKSGQQKPKAQTVEPKEVRTVNAQAAKTEALSAAGSKPEGITIDEKNFFMNLYPENANEIVDYHYYQKSGKMSGVSVGSILDRRG